jgi:hypothetical protein
MLAPNACIGKSRLTYFALRLTGAPGWYRGAVHRAEWQTITWVLVSAIIVYVFIGPNLVSWALAIVGVLGAFAKAGQAQWQRWQSTRSDKPVS